MTSTTSVVVDGVRWHLDAATLEVDAYEPDDLTEWDRLHAVPPGTAIDIDADLSLRIAAQARLDARK